MNQNANEAGKLSQASELDIAAATNAGFQVQQGSPDHGPDLNGRWWWTLNQPGWTGVETSHENFDTKASAWSDAVRMLRADPELSGKMPESHERRVVVIVDNGVVQEVLTTNGMVQCLVLDREDPSGAEYVNVAGGTAALDAMQQGLPKVARHRVNRAFASVEKELSQPRFAADESAQRILSSLRESANVESRPLKEVGGAVSTYDPFEVLAKLVKWAEHMGGWEASCWAEASQLLEQRQTTEAAENLSAGGPPTIGDSPVRTDAVATFIKRCGDNLWGECEQFPKEDWRYAVSNDDTILGYWEWVYNEAAVNDVDLNSLTGKVTT